jgi:Caspase domain
VKRLLANSLRVIALLATLAVAQAQAPIPEPRRALVIGNGAYSYGALTNPVNDAAAVAKALQDAGFDVMLETDANQAEMQGAIRSFSGTLKAKGGVGLFYFAGHGVQLAGENYLLPVGGHIAGEGDIKTGAVTATKVVDAMAAGNDTLNIVILDACRNNPLNPGGTRGLSRIDSNASLFVSYSTSPGAVALDGARRATAHTPSIAGKMLVVNWGDEHPVIYTPAKGGALDGECADGSATETLEPFSAPAPGHIALSDGAYKVEGKNPDGSDYTGTVEIAEQGNGYHLSWQVGSSSYEGYGTLAGNLLTVDWRSATPVVYALGPDGNLTGLWDAGNGEETLTPEE